MKYTISEMKMVLFDFPSKLKGNVHINKVDYLKSYQVKNILISLKETDNSFYEKNKVKIKKYISDIKMLNSPYLYSEKLDNKFINKYIEWLDISLLSANNIIKFKNLNTYKDKINFRMLDYKTYLNLSTKQIIKLENYIDFNKISMVPDLDVNIINRYFDKLNWHMMSVNELPYEILKKYAAFIEWKTAMIVNDPHIIKKLIKNKKTNKYIELSISHSSNESNINTNTVITYDKDNLSDDQQNAFDIISIANDKLAQNLSTWMIKVDTHNDDEIAYNEMVRDINEKTNYNGESLTSLNVIIDDTDGKLKPFLLDILKSLDIKNTQPSTLDKRLFLNLAGTDKTKAGSLASALNIPTNTDCKTGVVEFLGFSISNGFPIFSLYRDLHENTDPKKFNNVNQSETTIGITDDIYNVFSKGFDISEQTDIRHDIKKHVIGEHTPYLVKHIMES